MFGSAKITSLHNSASNSKLHTQSKHRRKLYVAAESTSSSNQDGNNKPLNNRRRYRTGKQPNLFEVVDVSPPSASLGVHELPPNTHNGDQIEVCEKSYVVQSVVMQYKLVHGKYRPNHKRLEVHNTGRFLMNRFLDSVFKMDGEPPINS